MHLSTGLFQQDPQIAQRLAHLRGDITRLVGENSHNHVLTGVIREGKQQVTTGKPDGDKV